MDYYSLTWLIDNISSADELEVILCRYLTNTRNSIATALVMAKALAEGAEGAQNSGREQDLLAMCKRMRQLALNLVEELKVWIEVWTACG
jgi:hypothetical protein